MNAEHLVHEVQALMPNATRSEVLQVACLVGVETEAGNHQGAAGLPQLVDDVRLRWKAAFDQFSAVSNEMYAIGRFDPCKFSPQQLWALLRSIKVQSQLLQLYTGRPVQSSPAVG
jgi:hypothetical protein